MKKCKICDGTGFIRKEKKRNIDDGTVLYGGKEIIVTRCVCNDKIDWKLIDPELFSGVVKVREFGNEKHKGQEWRNVPARDSADSIYRHAMKVLVDPYSIDEDSGMPHIWHIMCRCMMVENRRRMETKSDDRRDFWTWPNPFSGIALSPDIGA